MKTGEANSTVNTASASPVDDIAGLLLGDVEDQNDDQDTDESNIDDSTSDDSQTGGSKEIDDKSNSDGENLKADEESVDNDTWSSVLGIEEDKLHFGEDGNLLGIRTKVNGEEAIVKLGDLLVGYQNNKSNTLKSQQLSQQRKEFDQQREVLANAYSENLDNAETLAKFLESKLTAEYSGVNWEQLRVQDPAEYAAARQDYVTRFNEVKQALEAVRQDRLAHNAALQNQLKARRQEFLKSQYDKMLENNPSWIDANKRNSELSSFEKFAVSQYGFTNEEFGSLEDARLIEVLKDAFKYRNGVKNLQNKEAEKPLPKFQKANGRTTRKPSKLDALIKKAKTTSGGAQRDAQTSAIALLLSQSQ